MDTMGITTVNARTQIASTPPDIGLRRRDSRNLMTANASSTTKTAAMNANGETTMSPIVTPITAIAIIQPAIVASGPRLGCGSFIGGPFLTVRSGSTGRTGRWPGRPAGWGTRS